MPVVYHTVRLRGVSYGTVRPHDLSAAGPSEVFRAEDSGAWAHLKHLKNHCAAEETLELKVKPTEYK